MKFKNLAQEFKHKLLFETLPALAETITIAGGIVYVEFPDGSALDFTVPEEAERRPRICKKHSHDS